ncbi:MAG: DNA-binding transcriptional regulator [Steroidobacteraceae bacterium]
MPHGIPFLERLLHAIAERAGLTGGWTLTRLPEALGTSVAWLRDWPGDGAFAFIVTQADARIAQRLPFPLVNLASHLRVTGLPTVVVDHARIGEMAARHLLDRGFQRFGYYGASGLWFSQLRGESFRRTVVQAGGECKILEGKAGNARRGWGNQQQQLEAWVSTLRPPVGIMASNDLRAGMVLAACRQLNLRVPVDVAVIGVDNDPVFAEFDDPPLTSVSRNDMEVGRQAAALLAHLMAGGKAPAGPIYISPDAIIQRQSTETVAVTDSFVAQAISYIRKNIHRGFGVEELLKEVQISRRSLEYHFRRALQSSPYDYMNRMRVEAAKRLLAGPDRPKTSVVSKSCGFQDSRRFRLVFKHHTGITPEAYRRSLEP